MKEINDVRHRPRTAFLANLSSTQKQTLSGALRCEFQSTFCFVLSAFSHLVLKFIAKNKVACGDCVERTTSVYLSYWSFTKVKAYLKSQMARKTIINPF